MQQTVEHLPRDRVMLQVFAQVDTAHKEASGTHPGLEYQGELAARDPVVNDLHGRPQLLGQVIQNHGLSVADEIPPLPVAMKLRRERCQSWVFGIAQDAKCCGRLTTGPGRVPKDAGEAQLDLGGRVALYPTGREQEEDFATGVEHG